MFSPQKTDMTEGPLGKHILAFSVPLILTNLLQVFFNMADIAVVGRFAGTNALGAVGSTAILVTLFTGFLMGIGTGVNVIVARFLGARQDADVSETVHTCAILCVLIGLCILLLGQCFSYGMLALMHTKAELIGDATLYLRIYFLGMPALAVFNFGNAVLSAAGDTKRPLYYLGAAGVINVILNLFFVIQCHLDVAGVAIASIVAQYISAFLILRALLRGKDATALKISRLKINREKARMALRLGVPSGAQNAIFALANLFIQTGVNSFDTLMVAGNSAAVNADGLVYDVMAAFYTACSSFMSRNLGAGKRDRVLKSYFICMAYSFGAGLLMSGGILLMGRDFLSLFAVDSRVIDAGMQRLTIMCCSYAFSAFMDCTIAASRGLGKSFGPMIIVILGSCVFRVVWVYTIFAHFHTVPSLYLLYIFSWTLTAAAEIGYFVRCWKRQSIRI